MNNKTKKAWLTALASAALPLLIYWAGGGNFQRDEFLGRAVFLAAMAGLLAFALVKSL